MRRVGRSGLYSSEIGLGSLALGGGYGRAGEDESIGTIRQALDIGVTMLDTADFYAAGHVERLLGKAVAGRRDQAIIATRGGLRFDSVGRPTSVDGSPDHLRRACEASLRRLDVDHVDLYYLARVDPEVPVEDSVGVLGELVNAGKIRHVGLSRPSAQQLRRAHTAHPITAVASEYSLWQRRAEINCLPTARALGVGVVACRPFGRGFLTGQIASPFQLEAGDYRHGDPRFWPRNFVRHQRLMPAAMAMAADLDLSLARLSLAWLLSRNEDVVPVPSTRNRIHLEMNASASGIRLTPEECDRLTRLFPEQGQNA